MENKNSSSVLGSPSAPYLNGLAGQCGLATDYHAISHPSLPNYIAATSGGTQGITNDDAPAVNARDVPSIFSQVGTDGWRSYQESMPGNCVLAGGNGLYAVRHNPAAYYTGIAPACQANDVPMTSATDLSAPFTFITPNLCDDMHNGSVATGDSWLAGFVPRLLASAEYTSGTTLLVITWDENDGPNHEPGNQVATLVVAPTVAPGARSSTYYDHYSLLRTTESCSAFRCWAPRPAPPR